MKEYDFTSLPEEIREVWAIDLWMRLGLSPSEAKDLWDSLPELEEEKEC